MRYRLAAFLLATCTLAAAETAPSLPKPQEVQTNDFRGRLYLPTAAPKPLAVVLIGGSEGHLYLADEVAPQLASQGYAILGVDYHDGFDPGRKLDLVPIETFTHAVAWLRASPVHPRQIVVLGDSRGSEAALLTGIYDASVAGVLALVPSSVLWGATDNDATRHNPAWSWQGKPLACANCTSSGDFTAVLDTIPLDDPARVPVERIHGPIFLAGSYEDAVWPSARMASDIATRLREKHFGDAVTLLTFPHSSHNLLGTGPKDPITVYQYAGKSYTMNAGGTAAGTEEARNQTWAGILLFLANVSVKSAPPPATPQSPHP